MTETTTVTETTKSTGFVWNGKPVPWLTRWTEEMYPGPVSFDHQRGRLLFMDGYERRDLGVLWMREVPGKHGQGEPEFKQVSTIRQMEAMLHGNCQVCGEPIDDDIRIFMIPAVEAKMHKPNGKPLRTATPPVCRKCVPFARRVCPNLKMYPPTILQVKHYRPWGVFGEIVPKEGGHRRCEVPLGFGDLDRVLARQLVVELYDYRRQPGATP